MEVKDDVTTEIINLQEEELIDLPVAEEQANETNGGATKATPKLFLVCADGAH
jgi:hypothetical protein